MSISKALTAHEQGVKTLKMFLELHSYYLLGNMENDYQIKHLLSIS